MFWEPVGWGGGVLKHLGGLKGFLVKEVLAEPRTEGLCSAVGEITGNREPWAHPHLTISHRRCRLRAITTMVGWTRYPPGLKEKSRPSQVTFSRCLGR